MFAFSDCIGILDAVIIVAVKVSSSLEAQYVQSIVVGTLVLD